MAKAIGLLSGGLDSTLAVRMMLDQGIEVLAVNFTGPFCTCTKKGCRHEASRVAETMSVEIRLVQIGQEYIDMLRNPKHGYGKNMNPCIDCRIFTFRKAREIMEQEKADFIFTGEVLGQRPMSQRMEAMRIIEEESGLKGHILRPLSAMHFKPTEAEMSGLVDRSRLLDISGRGRTPQIELAEDFEIKDYHCPAGGCLLTDKEFSARVRDLFAHEKYVTINDLMLLKLGRHFRHGGNKFIVGRNQAENESLVARKRPEDFMFEVPDCGSPTTLLQGSKTEESVGVAAALTARYSDSTDANVLVRYGQEKLDSEIQVEPISLEKAEAMMIGSGSSVQGCKTPGGMP